MYGATWKSLPLTNMGPTPKEYGCTPAEFCENQSSIPNEFLNFYLTPKEILNFYNIPLKNSMVPQQVGEGSGWVQV